MYIEEWNFFDSLYMSVITLTTIGYDEVHELSYIGRIFTLIFVFFGVGLVFYGITVFAENFISSDFLIKNIIGRRLRTMKDHYIICGYGRMGKRIVRELQHLGKPYVVIERHAEEVAKLRQSGIIAIEGDATVEENLIEAGIENACGLVAALTNDAANVFVVLTTRGLNENLHIVARAESLASETKFLRAGANSVLSAYDIGAVRLTHLLLKNNVIDSFELATKQSSLDVSIEEFVVSPDSDSCGSTLRELFPSGRRQALVMAIKKNDRDLEFPPKADTVLEAGFTIVVAAATSDMKKLRSVFDTSTMEKRSYG